MLIQLQIDNVAIIEHVAAEFDAGLNVLSGETGAGKSILIDAVNFVLGERADRDIIRTGAPSVRVEAVFALGPEDPTRLPLEEMGIDGDDTLILSRELNQSGRNTCRINGVQVTVAQLRAISSHLVDIHGQHEHQSLLQADRHLWVLDAVGGADLLALRDRADGLLDVYRLLHKRLESLQMDEQTRLQRMDMLRFQIVEIEQAHLTPGEEEELSARSRIIGSLEKINEALAAGYRCLYEGERGQSAAADALTRAQQQLERIRAIAPDFEALYARLDSAVIEVTDIAEQLRDQLGRYEFDERELEATESRLALIRTLERKYGHTVEEMLAYLDEIRREYEALSQRAQTTQALAHQLSEAEQAWRDAAGELGRKRLCVARYMEKAVGAQLKDLGLGGARFEVQLQSAGGEPRRGGDDDVCFLLSANPGEPVRPLNRVVSGGELSRIMLALKNVLAEGDGVGTLIFDEIDAGVSGRMALVVAQKLYSVSKVRQILCVTHTAQIAAMGDRHYLIEKHVTDGRTATSVTALTGDARAEEISRMVGGEEISSKSLAHAREMLDWCRDYKKGKN